MSPSPRVLLIGTADTKSAELLFMRACLEQAGATVRLMDVGVLGPAAFVPEIPNTQVAAAAGATLQAVIDSGDENSSMSRMALGAATLAARLHADGEIDGLLALGGTMGTDLAFDVAQALPIGVPKVVVSTVAYSHLIPPERVPPDLMMMLWAGGLYGLNSLCRSALAQACGAVVGAIRAAQPPRFERPLIGMTSLGKSCLRYMVTLKPALEARGFEVAVFHTTGMGGRAFEALAAGRRFAAVLDLSLQELANHLGGSCVSAGANRLLGAGLAGVPQIVAPGAIDMVDFPAWMAAPAALAGRPVHEHNRLIASATSAPGLRRDIAAELVSRLARASGPSCLVLPLRGVEAWDGPGQPLHDPEGLAAFVDEIRRQAPGRVPLHEVDAHINDEAFSRQVLAIFDDWLERGLIDRRAARPEACEARHREAA